MKRQRLKKSELYARAAELARVYKLDIRMSRRYNYYAVDSIDESHTYSAGMSGPEAAWYLRGLSDMLTVLERSKHKAA